VNHRNRAARTFRQTTPYNCGRAPIPGQQFVQTVQEGLPQACLLRLEVVPRFFGVLTGFRAQDDR